MSYFAQLLEANNLPKHDGRALWRYGISEELFYNLQQHLRSTPRLFNIDPRDCALYYAAWWKCNYNGSSPSKQQVFSSIATGHTFDEHTFFEFAKVGATRLGIRWIRNQNTLYFRTLLLQGGLPVKHISNYPGAYTRFLTKVLEMNPNSIDDFAFDPSITSLLPTTSRNDEIYSCCLEIVKAILSGDEDYLSKVSEDEAIDKIRTAIEIKKPLISSQSSKSRFRTVWVLELDKEQIRLYLSIPSDFERNEFNQRFLKDDPIENLVWEYNLFYENGLLCKFTRNSGGDYKKIWEGQNNLEWDGSSSLLELYMLDSNGKRYDCSHIVNYVPQLIKPSLWSKYSDTQWILERGWHTSQQEAMVLFPNSCQTNQPEGKQSITLHGQMLQWQSFDGEVTTTINTETYRFKSKYRKIDWLIADEKPFWMRTANFPVVQGKPKIDVYDEQGERITSVKKCWRRKGEGFWRSWNELLAKGLIEISIEANNITEQDEVYNIGDLRIETVSNSLHKADLTLKDKDFTLSITPNPLISIVNDQNKISLTREDNNLLPKSIHGSLSLRGQHRSLLFEINPPFKGFEIINNQDEIMPDSSVFRLNTLGGYRLITNEKNVVVNFYNIKRRKIILSEKLDNTALPLKHFEERILQLYSLSDPMDGVAEIIMEVGIEKHYSFQLIKEYRICRYDQQIKRLRDEDGDIVVQTKPDCLDLFAVPLDCTNDVLDIYDLENTSGQYRFRNKIKWENCIVFSSADSGIRIQPAFVSLSGEIDLTTPDSTLISIARYRDELLKSSPQDNIWKQQLMAYYTICQNNNLSFATFNILRACGFSSELAAKFFLFLLCNTTNNDFLEQFYRKFEDDIGFFFHWVSREHWSLAMDWVGCIEYPELVEACGPSIKTIFTNQHPTKYFNGVFQYVMQGKKPSLTNDFLVNQKIATLREALGIKVQRGIPKESPAIPKEYQHILPITVDNRIVQLMLTAPVAVALSIAGKDDTLWHLEHEDVRRNVKYCYNLCYSLQSEREWYGEAIIYTLTKI